MSGAAAEAAGEVVYFEAYDGKGFSASFGMLRDRIETVRLAKLASSGGTHPLRIGELRCDAKVRVISEERYKQLTALAGCIYDTSRSATKPGAEP